MTHDPVDQFLMDAERAAKHGDRQTALDLIVLALDTAAPGDPSVLVRAHGIRTLLAAAYEPGDRSPRPDPVSTSPVAEDLSALLDLPEIGQISLRDREEEEQAERQFSVFAPVEMDDAEAPTAPAHYRREVAPEVAVPKKKRRRITVHPALVLWPVLMAVGFFAFQSWRRPDFLQSAVHRVQGLWDPFIRAQQALDEGDLPRAARAAEQLLGAGEHTSFSHLVLGLDAQARGSAREALLHLRQVAEPNVPWERAWQAAEALAELGETAAAADAYFAAYQAGAPIDRWPTIAGALDAAGRPSTAANIREILGGRRSKSEPTDTTGGALDG